MGKRWERMTRKLDASIGRRQEEKKRQEKNAEEVEFQRLEAKYDWLPEYDELQDAIDDLLTFLDENPDVGHDIHTPIPGAPALRATEARDRFFSRARELESQDEQEV